MGADPNKLPHSDMGSDTCISSICTSLEAVGTATRLSMFAIRSDGGGDDVVVAVSPSPPPAVAVGVDAGEGETLSTLRIVAWLPKTPLVSACAAATSCFASATASEDSQPKKEDVPKNAESEAITASDCACTLLLLLPFAVLLVFPPPLL